MRLETRNLFLYWLPALAWTAVVLSLSTDRFSAAHTGSVLQYILLHTIGNISADAFEEIHFVVRKSAHVTEYGILGLLYFRAFRGERAREWCFAWSRQALAVVLLIAGIDEFHQSFLPSRGSSQWDVLLDFTAAPLFLAVFWLAWRWKYSRQPELAAD